MFSEAGVCNNEASYKKKKSWHLPLLNLKVFSLKLLYFIDNLNIFTSKRLYRSIGIIVISLKIQNVSTLGGSMSYYVSA